MKTAQHILTFCLLVMFFSCGQPNEIKKTSSVGVDSLQKTQDKKENEESDKRIQIEKQTITDSLKHNKASVNTLTFQEQAIIDSLRHNQVLGNALKIAYQNIGKNKFYYSGEVIPDSISVKVDISLGTLFTNTHSYLIIRSHEPGSTYIEIYVKNKNKFEKVLSHEQWALTYLNDTIQDVNGDGLKDFVVNWYGSTGCCLKAFSDVYLLRSNKKAFSNNFQFINPTFSPNEKTIRGVCYGHPGETEMYKYRWNGEKIDTIEYVSYEKNEKGIKTGKIVISTDRFYRENGKVLKRLNSVPPEYKTIEGYDWFTGNL